MFLPSRNSRQPSTTSNNHRTTNGSTPASSPTDNQPNNSQLSSASASVPPMSKDSEGYPSWLPKRPPPPAPASTVSAGLADYPETDTDPEMVANMGGRQPTSRSVRIVSLHGVSRPDVPKVEKRERKHSTRPPHSAQAWSKGTAPIANGVGGFHYPYFTSTRLRQPKFNAKGLHLDLLRNPSIFARLYFYLFPILVFAHLPLQTFFDFNAVYMLILVSRYPNPAAPGIPGSGKNWALAAAAYIACWMVWIFIVFLFYELVYSFIRRWRIKRPNIMTIYLSSPASTFASMTSYTNFSFFLHLRISAFVGEHGNFRDGLAESFYWYSQNLPTVALLIPRAGLCLALLFAFSSAIPGLTSFSSMRVSHRDGTFFREDGTLTSYARGVLIANAVWAAWRILVLLISWIGLWIISGEGCAGLCGPRYRWEEEEAEKTRSSIYSNENDSNRDIDALPWSWKECTRHRIQEAYDFCLTTRPSLRWGNVTSGNEEKDKEIHEIEEPDPIEVQRVLAAVGIPSVPAPARRRPITEDFFDSPEKEIELQHRESDKGVGPSTLPYPFNQIGSAQVSSKDKVAFPPSSPSKKSSSATTTTTTTTTSGSTETSTGSEEEEEDFGNSEEPSTTGHNSGSMSSLGHPIPPSRRYPFSFNRPAAARTHNRMHSASTHQSRPSQSGVSYSGISQSTGNRPSTSDSSSRPRASLSQSSMNSGIPMPPRHPNIQNRSRAPSIPLPDLPATVEFPSLRIRQGSGASEVGLELELVIDDDDDDIQSVESSGSEELNEEGHDSVGLLSPGGSHVNLEVPRSRSHSGSRSRTGSSSRSRANSNKSGRSRVDSLGVIRTRAQSLLQSVSATSLEMVKNVVGSRSRTNSSMARLEEEAVHQLPELPSRSRVARDRDASGSTTHSTNANLNRFSFANPQAWEDRGYMTSSTHSRSGSGSGSGGENWTFGVPMPFARPQAGISQLREEVLSDNSSIEGHSKRLDSGTNTGNPSTTRHGREVEAGEEIATSTFGAPLPRPATSTTPQRPSIEEPRPRDSISIPPAALVGPGMPGAAMMGHMVSTSPTPGSVSTSAAASVFYTPQGSSTRTASPTSRPESGSGSSDIQAQNVNPIDIPWGRYRLHEPSSRVSSHSQTQAPRGRAQQLEQQQQQEPTTTVTTTSTSTSTSPPDISTAAQSFVTVPVTIGGVTSSDELTERGSLNEDGWNERAMRGSGIGNVGLGPSGLGPERGDSMGDWRVQ